jgi:TP901 family phage tail tape measure protein
MAENVAELIISLLDQVSAPARLATASIRGLVGDVNRASISFESFSRRATRGFDSAIAGLTKTAVVAGAAAAALYKPIKSASEFAETLKDLQLGTHRTDTEMEALSDRFLKLSKSLNIGVQAIAAASLDLPVIIRKNTDAMLLAEEAAGKFSRGTNTDFAEAMKLVTPLTQNLGIALGDLPRAFDFLTKAEQRGKLPLEELTGAFGRMSTELRSLGMTGTLGFGQMLSVITAIGQQTGNAGEAIGDFQRIIEKLYAKKTWQMTGLDPSAIVAQAGRAGVNPIKALITELQRWLTSSGLSAGQQKGLITEIFGPKFSLGAQSLLDMLKNIDEVTKDIYKSSGATNEAFIARQAEWTEAWKTLSIAAENFGITIGRVVGPVLAPFIDQISGIVAAMSAWSETHPRIIKDLVFVTGSVLALTGGIYGIRAAVFAVTIALNALMAHPLIAFLLGLTGGAAALWNHPGHALGGSGLDALRRYFGPGGTANQLFGGKVAPQSFTGGGGLFHLASFGAGTGGSDDSGVKGIWWRLDKIAQLLQFTTGVLGAGFSGIPGWKYQGAGLGGSRGTGGVVRASFGGGQ